MQRVVDCTDATFPDSVCRRRGARRLAPADRPRRRQGHDVARLGPAAPPTARSSSRVRAPPATSASRSRPSSTLYRGSARRGRRGRHGRLRRPSGRRRPWPAACRRRSPRSTRRRRWHGADGALNVVRVGGSGYSVLTRDAGGRVRLRDQRALLGGYRRNGRGPLRAASAAASTTPSRWPRPPTDGVAVTSRCAVFAKSELTHFANQGEPHGRLFRGAVRERGPQRAQRSTTGTGGRARPHRGPRRLDRTAGRRRSRDLAGVPVEVVGAGGRLRGARRSATTPPRRTGPAGAAGPADPAALDARARGGAFARSDAGGRGPRFGRRSSPAPATPTAGASGDPSVLGLDLGSTGSKAALRRAAGGRRAGRRLPAHRRQPRGGGAGAWWRRSCARRGCADGGGRRPHRLGPRRGRYRVPGRLPRARRAPRACENEIVAHATAAVRFDPEGGRSLSIVEIGGQDAKFIAVARRPHRSSPT